MSEDVVDAHHDEETRSHLVQGQANQLAAFRKWLKDAQVEVHPSIRIVNGATTANDDEHAFLGREEEIATKQQEAVAEASSVQPKDTNINFDRTLYDMGCQVEASGDIDEGEVLMVVPKHVFVSPDLVACSDAGRAVLSCIRHDTDSHYWDAFENTALLESQHTDTIAATSGRDVLEWILEMRKKGTQASTEHERGKTLDFTENLVEVGVVSTRAPLLAFLIHQRFSEDESPSVVGASDNSLTLSSSGMRKPPNSPSSFAAYARVLPAHVALPLCWKREELAMLCDCISGLPLLQEVAGMTMQLASEFEALVKAGLTTRFPSVFPQGQITFERWLWAASVFASRALPVSCYIDKGQTSETSAQTDWFQSTPSVWDELGVMIPCLDMLNHENDNAQVTWEPCVPMPEKGDGMKAHTDGDTEENSPHPPRAVAHSKIEHGSQLFCCYGMKNNKALIAQYGFGFLNNPADETHFGWGLRDAVGDTLPEAGYQSPFHIAVDGCEAEVCHESSDATKMMAWWSKDRLVVLQGELNLPDHSLQLLTRGEKLNCTANSDGSYDPVFLSASLVATLRTSTLADWTPSQGSTQSLSNEHLQLLRYYLTQFFVKKAEKLTRNLLDGGLTELASLPNKNMSWGDLLGWLAGRISRNCVQVGTNHYSVGPESCVLTLFHGQLRGLQLSVHGLSTEEKFRDGVVKQLQEMGYTIETTNLRKKQRC